MNEEYKTWKENYEAEFAEHRKENTRLIYRYQSEYDAYVNNPEWVQVGDFCNFVRRTALNKGAEITAKYEAELIANDAIFAGFCLDEFERIHLWKTEAWKPEDHEDVETEASNIFEYCNMKTRLETLTPEQESLFRKAITEHLLQHEEDIQTVKRYFERKNELFGGE